MPSTENNYVATDLGNIALNPCGEYSKSTLYEYLDMVSYQGGSYFCKVDFPQKISGIAPEPGKNTEMWQMLTLPGQLTPEAIAMHDDVVNKAKQVETSRAAVELSQQEVEAAQADVQQMRQDTQEAAEQAIASRDSAAGYAQSAETSRTAARESEDNVNAQVAGFDTRVAEKTSDAETAIAEARQTAVSAVSTKQDEAMQAVTDEGDKQIKNVEDAGTEQVGKVKSAGASAVSAAGAAGVSAVNAVKTQQTASIKAVADEGTKQVGAVDTADTTQVNAVNTAGKTQVEAVNAAGDAQVVILTETAAKELVNLQEVAEQFKDDHEQIGSLKEDLAYKINSRLTPIQFETVLGYYNVNGFVTGKKEWGARLMRVQCKKGDKYLYHGYCDNIYGVSFLDSEFRIIRQISVPKNKEFEMDVIAIDNASYIDFYSGNSGMKTYVLKYNREDTSNNDVGKIFIDASSQLSETDNKYFSPIKEELVYGHNMKLKEITPENDTVFKFSFIQNQAATAYVDDFCIVTSNNYVSGTEVFHENIIVFVPKGKTLRINDFKSNVYVSKFEKLVPITEEYINEKIPDVPKTVDTVTDGEFNPVSSNAVYHAIETNVAQVSTGLPYIAVASSEAPTAIKSVCQYVCDGTNDEIEIQNAINSLGSTGGKVFLTKGKFFISQSIETGNTLIELCGEGALLDLREDTLNSPDRGGTILQAVGNTDLLHIGGAKGTTVHDIAFFGYGRNKVDNTSYGIRFTGYADTDRIYNCGFTNCAVAIGADIQTDVLYIHNLSVQRNKVGICLYRSDAEVHDCLFCENIGMENVSWDNKTYNINCADICVNDGKIYNNTFRRSGMCYDIFKVYGNESGLEFDDVRPVSSVVLLGCARIIENYFFDKIYANCIRVMSRTDFVYIEGNSFTKWGHKDQADDCRKSAICFDAGSVLGTIMNNRFYSDSNTEKFTDKYAIYENNTDGDNSYWRYSNTYMNNFIGNLTADTENKCRIIGTAPQNQFINNIVVNR